MTKDESLKIISEMIEAAKSEVKGNQFYFLFWGWLTIAIHALHYYLLQYTTVANPERVWSLAALGGIFTAIHSARHRRKQQVVTHFDTAIGYVWLAYGITLVILMAASIQFRFPVYATVTVLTAFPTFITGILVKFKPLIYFGSLFWIFGAYSFTVAPADQILVGAVALVLGYLVPGYMIKYSK